MTQEEIALQDVFPVSQEEGTVAQPAASTPQDRPQKLTALLKDLMAARSITPTQLAADLGLNPSNVTGFLQGKKNPTLSTLDRLAAALSVPAWMLLNTPQEVLADLRAMGLTDSADSAEKCPAAATVVGGSLRAESLAETAETPASGLGYDLLTVDPVTGTVRRYRLINP